jgi:hypothetical protein
MAFRPDQPAFKVFTLSSQELNSMKSHYFSESIAKPYLMAMVAALILVTASPVLLRSAEVKGQPSTSLPFAPGECLKFRLRWTVVPAGEASLEVLPYQTVDGQKAYHFRLIAKSNLLVDQFFKVRDRIDAFASADMTCAIRYRQKQHEGNNHKTVEVRFDWEKGIALYSDGKSDSSVKIKPGTFDPLSVFYYSRMADFGTHGRIQRPVSDGKKCVEGKARIIKKETIKVISGWYDTYLIEPDIKHVGGVFKKSKNAKIRIWVTADEKRLPVKIASKVAVGSFVGELVAIENASPQKNI